MRYGPLCRLLRRRGGLPSRLAVLLDLPGVFFQGGGEAAVTLGVGYEIEVIGAGGVRARPSGPQCREFAIGPGRQSGMAVSVVGRGVLQVGGT